MVHEEEAAGVEGNLSSQENKTETLNLLCLNSVDGKHKYLEQDTDNLVDQ